MTDSSKTVLRTIKIDAYLDANGDPTCCTDWTTARCRFVSVRKLGTVEVCSATGRDIQRGPAGMAHGEFSNDPSKHLLRPVHDCQVWAGYSKHGSTE